LCYAEHENGEGNAAYVPVLTGECQAIAGFRWHTFSTFCETVEMSDLQKKFLFFAKKFF